jgi:hypothetical protein
MDQEYNRREQSMSQVSPGMLVIDATGGVVGTVDIVRLGDANAVTVQPPVPGAGGSLDGLISSVAGQEPDVPADAAARLLREGYVKVDSGRPRAVYVEADQIRTVDETGVRLSVPAADLVAEE